MLSCRKCHYGSSTVCRNPDPTCWQIRLAQQRALDATIDDLKDRPAFLSRDEDERYERMRQAGYRDIFGD